MNKKISTDDITKITEFVLKYNFYEFNGKVKKQVSRTAICTKFAIPYACIRMDINNVFSHGKEKRGSFSGDLNKFYHNIKFTHETNKESIHF